MKDFSNENVQLDPDINPNVLKDRLPGWKGLFGQCDVTQQHLYTNNIQLVASNT